MASADASTEKEVLWDVTEEHLSEAGFRWTLWQDRLSALDFTLDELLELDEELLLAHIDGLVSGGAPVEEQLLLPAIEEDDAEKSFAATLSLLLSETTDRSTPVMQRLEASKGECLRGIQGALMLAAPAALEPQLISLQESSLAEVPTAATEILSCRGMHFSSKLIHLEPESDPALALALLAACRTPHGRPFGTLVVKALRGKDERLRDEAILSGCVLCNRVAWDVCQRVVAAKAGSLGAAAMILGLLGGQDEFEQLNRLLEDEKLVPAALWALGFLGRVETADTCLELMGAKTTARRAAEAFCFITGLNLETEGFVAPEAEEESLAEIADSAESAREAPVEEDQLPLPKVEGIRRWWNERRGSFQKNQRYLLGARMGPEVFLRALDGASLRRRQGLLLEAAIRTRGNAWVETRSLCCQQLGQQKGLQGLKPQTFQTSAASLFGTP